MDAPLSLELIAQASALVRPNALSLLDIGCGAGNYSLKLLEYLPNLDVTLLDLSRPMLDRALCRVQPATRGEVKVIQGDIRQVPLEPLSFDLIVAGAVLHHLREEEEWDLVFRKLYHVLKEGGALWISDLVAHSIPQVQELMWTRYGEYLKNLKDEAYREHVFQYVQREDSPRPLIFQLDLLRKAGFVQVDLLHKNGCFAVFGAVK
jgi:tRNA (cmo5U34)-methyltransferase